MQKHFPKIVFGILFAFLMPVIFFSFLFLHFEKIAHACAAKCDDYIFFCYCSDDAQGYNQCNEWGADEKVNCLPNALVNAGQEIVWRSRAKIDYSPAQDPIDIKYRITYSNCYFTGFGTPLSSDGCMADWYDDVIDYSSSEVDSCSEQTKAGNKLPSDKCYYKLNRCSSSRSQDGCVFESMLRYINVALVRYQNLSKPPDGQFDIPAMSYIKQTYGMGYPSFVCAFVTTEDREDSGAQFVGCVKEKFMPSPPPYGMIPTYIPKPTVAIPVAADYSKGKSTTTQWFQKNGSLFESPVVSLIFDDDPPYNLKFKTDLIVGNPYARCSEDLTPDEGGQYSACILPSNPEYICVYSQTKEKLEKTADYSEYAQNLIGCTPRPSMAEGSHYTITADIDIVCALPQFDLKSLKKQGTNPKIPKQVSVAGYDYKNSKCIEAGYRPYIGVVPLLVSGASGGSIIGKDTAGNDVYIGDKTKFFGLYKSNGEPSTDGILKLAEAGLLHKTVNVVRMDIALRDDDNWLGYDYNSTINGNNYPKAMREVFVYYKLLMSSKDAQARIIGQKPMYGRDQAVIGPGIITGPILDLKLLSSDKGSDKGYADLFNQLSKYDDTDPIKKAIDCVNHTCAGKDASECASCMTMDSAGSITELLVEKGLRPTIAPQVKVIIPCLPGDESCVTDQTSPIILLPNAPPAGSQPNCNTYYQGTVGEFYFFPKNIERRARDFCYCDGYNCKDSCQGIDCMVGQSTYGDGGFGDTPCRNYDDWSNIVGDCIFGSVDHNDDCSCPLCGYLKDAKGNTTDVMNQDRVCPGIYNAKPPQSGDKGQDTPDRICFYPTENWDFISGKQMSMGSFWNDVNVDTTNRSIVCAQLPATCSPMFDQELWNHFGTWPQGSSAQGAQSAAKSGTYNVQGTCPQGWEPIQDAHLYGFKSAPVLCEGKISAKFAELKDPVKIAEATAKALLDYGPAYQAFKEILYDAIINNKQISANDFTQNDAIKTYIDDTDECVLSVQSNNTMPTADCIGGMWTNFSGGYCVKSSQKS